MKQTKAFRFKQFSIEQDRCAMKVGTDGVLLGAWTDLSEQPASILDIGTGTGLIALMLAQRSVAGLIDALEIEPNAYEQAVENFERSEWSDRLFCYHASLQEFVSEIDGKYDLIVANPPFYNSTFKTLAPNRALARHTTALTYDELLSATTRLLTDKGSCAFIIPFKEETHFLDLAAGNGLHPYRITHVKGHENAVIKRSLIQLSFDNAEYHPNVLTLESERNKRTAEYQKLVNDFYLNP